MLCKECQSREVIKVPKKDRVMFMCKNGHKWFEEYIDNGGAHARPKSYNVKLNDILFPSERVLYDQILKKIGQNMVFFTSSSPEKITTYLIDECQFDREEIYRLFKKVTDFNNNNNPK